MRKYGNSAMGRVITEVELSNYEDIALAKAGSLAQDKVRTVRLSGVVDTGANWLVLPETIAKQLGLPEAGSTKVSYADKRSDTREMVTGIQLSLLGRTGLFKAIVEPQRTTALIGAIVLEDLDLLVDCKNQSLQPRDPKGYTAEIE